MRKRVILLQISLLLVCFSAGAQFVEQPQVSIAILGFDQYNGVAIACKQKPQGRFRADYAFNPDPRKELIFSGPSFLWRISPITPDVSFSPTDAATVDVSLSGNAFGKSYAVSVIATWIIWDKVSQNFRLITARSSVTLVAIKVKINGEQFVKKYADESAPNITLTATAFPEGGNYSWSVTYGADKAECVGNVYESTVTIKGARESSQNGDVHVEVTYKVDGVTCKDTHVLTVQRPAILKHGELNFILNQVTRLGIPICFTVGVATFRGTLYDQLGNTMAGVPFSEDVTIDKANSIPDSGYSTLVITGSGSTSSSGQYEDVYAVPVLGEAPDNMNIKVQQILIFGGYRGINNINLTKTNVSDSYPVNLTTP